MLPLALLAPLLAPLTSSDAGSVAGAMRGVASAASDGVSSEAAVDVGSSEWKGEEDEVVCGALGVSALMPYPP